MATIPTTLQRYLFEALRAHPEQLDLVVMMSDIATVAKLISAQTNRAGLTDLLGLAGGSNVHDEQQAQLDVYANDLCKNYLGSSGLFAALASEEEERPVDLHNDQAKYVIAFDPLDGSANIDVNVGIGTIFAVHRKLAEVPDDDERQFLQPGKDLVVGGYVLYGSSTMLVFSWGDGVHMFTLDVDLGEFILSDAHVKLPAECPYYSTNEAYVAHMAQPDQEYAAMVRKEVPKLRWIASLVADFHRNLIKGGVYFLPAFDTSGKGEFKPKLRLVYELQPLAFLLEQAGGLAVADGQRILDIIPHELHQRAPVVMGNSDMVKRYKEQA